MFDCETIHEFLLFHIHFVLLTEMIVFTEAQVVQAIGKNCSNLWLQPCNANLGMQHTLIVLIWSTVELKLFMK